ncbi:MAG: transcription antitermination factor NusB [Clostridia bacterium]|nr:transcription antitermination factor NusB [Clostridia bacterium]
MNRALVREVAMKILYAEVVGGAEDKDSVIEQSEFIDDLDTKDMEFLNNILLGVREHRAEIDTRIAEGSTSRSLDQIPKIELTLLRIAIYEFLYEPTIPIGAAISEAVVLAKKYGDVRSYAFVNAVLAAVSKTVER